MWIDSIRGGGRRGRPFECELAEAGFGGLDDHAQQPRERNIISGDVWEGRARWKGGCLMAERAANVCIRVFLIV